MTKYNNFLYLFFFVAGQTGDGFTDLNKKLGY